MQISTWCQKPSLSLFSSPGMLRMNGHDAAHPLDWRLEAGPTITALGGEHSGCWRAWADATLTQFGSQPQEEPNTTAQPSLAPWDLGIRRSVLITRWSLLLKPEQGPECRQSHLCSTAAPFSTPFSSAAPKKALVTQRANLYKAFPVLCIEITAKLCLPGASETRCSCAGVYLCVQNGVEVCPALGTSRLLTSQTRQGLPAFQWHGFYSEFLPSLPKDIIALLQKPFVES